MLQLKKNNESTMCQFTDVCSNVLLEVTKAFLPQQRKAQLFICHKVLSHNMSLHCNVSLFLLLSSSADCQQSPEMSLTLGNSQPLQGAPNFSILDGIFGHWLHFLSFSLLPVLVSDYLRTQFYLISGAEQGQMGEYQVL